MESTTKNRKTREQVARMVERAFGGTTLAAGEDAVSELKEGWFNAAYNVRLSDGREVILKIAPLKDAEVLAYEKNIMATEVASMRCWSMPSTASRTPTSFRLASTRWPPQGRRSSLQ